MKLFSVIIYFALYYACLGEEIRNPKGKHTALKKMKDMLKGTGTLSYQVKQYAFEPSESLINYAKSLTKQKSSESLKDLTPEDIDKIFALYNQSGLEELNIATIELKAEGPELFSHNNSKWKWHTFQKDGEIARGESSKVPANKPRLTSEKDGFSFEFILGPKFSEAKEVSGILSDDNRRIVTYGLSEPTLEVQLKGRKQMIKYTIFIHPVSTKAGSLVPSTKDEKQTATKAFNLIRGVTENLMKNIDASKPEKDLGADYELKSKSQGLRFSDTNAFSFIGRWIKPVNNTYVIVNLYGVVKQFLMNHEVLVSYIKNENIPRNPHEFEVEGFGDRLLFIDKLPGGTSFVGPKSRTNFGSPTDKASKFMLQSLKTNSGQMVKLAEKKGIQEESLGRWQHWIEKKLEHDFEKHRKLAGIKQKFRPVDRHFSFRKMDNFQPVEQTGTPFDEMTECESSEPDYESSEPENEN